MVHYERVTRIARPKEGLLRQGYLAITKYLRVCHAAVPVFCSAQNGSVVVSQRVPSERTMRCAASHCHRASCPDRSATARAGESPKEWKAGRTLTT
jgi:hypothetical protein